MRRNESYKINAVILFNALFGGMLLKPILGVWYLYAYTPVFWLLVFLLTWVMRGGGLSVRKRLKSSVTFWTVGGAGMYVVLYFFSGLLSGFG